MASVWVEGGWGEKWGWQAYDLIGSLRGHSLFGLTVLDVIEEEVSCYYRLQSLKQGPCSKLGPTNPSKYAPVLFCEVLAMQAESRS